MTDSADSRGHVLVVDDDDSAARVVERVLEAAGYTVDVVLSGENALHQLRTRSYDIVISDVMMPGMDGFELLRRMRSDSRLALLPVVLLTALHDEDRRAEGFQLGADAYLMKPVRFDKLVRTVERARLSARRMTSVPPSEAVLTGRLDSIGPVVVLTLVGALKKTGSLSLQRGRSRGRITFRDGRPVSAALGSGLQGREAIFQLLSWADGEFRFGEAKVDETDTIAMDVGELVAELRRRKGGA